ncbi:MAG TPA: hypothetical protein VGD66_07690 [Allosphingosinicella sp.]|jgi:hypothetical protein
MRPLLLIAPLLLFACDKPPPAPQPKQRTGPVATRPAQRQPEQPAPPAAAGDAAATLARYYSHIEQGDYDGAWAMRTASDGIDRARFAANFKVYESYRAQVGAPSLPVRAGDWDYVEVPVMITGRLRGGRAFGSAGSVSLRRAHDGSDRAWRVFTG